MTKKGPQEMFGHFKLFKSQAWANPQPGQCKTARAAQLALK